MKALTVLTFVSFLVASVLSQEITSTSVLVPFDRNQTHIFEWQSGPVSIDARIFSRGDFSDFFMLDYKGVNVFLWDTDQMHEFYSVLKSYAEEKPVPGGIKVNGTWSTSMSTGRLIIGDAARNRARLKRKHLEFMLECMEKIIFILNAN